MGPGPAAELMSSWEGRATVDLQVGYEVPPTFDAYFAAHYPRSAQKVEAQDQDELPGWARRRLARAQDEYLGVVARINQSNEGGYDKWRDVVAEICIEAGSLALMAGNEDLANQLLSGEKVPEGQAGRSDELGMGMLASGRPDEAKHILLRSSESFPFMHAQNLLDAYRASDDPDYRSTLMHSFGVEPYLLARLARHDLSKGRPAEDLFGAAEGRQAVCIAVAAVLAKSTDESTALRYGKYLDAQAEKLKPPGKQWKTRTEIAKEAAADRFHQDGIWAPVTWAFDLFEAGLDALEGGGLPKKSPEPTPEYGRWWDETIPLLADTWPHLIGRQGFDEYLKGFTSAVAEETDTFNVQLNRAEWGDSQAAINALAFDSGKQQHRMVAYRHLLRDIGPVAAIPYINRVPNAYRRNAIYYTLVSFALQGGVVLSAPELPDMTDTHGPILELHRRIRAEASGSSEYTDEAVVKLAGTEAQVNATDLQTVSQVELADLLAKVEAIQDPADRERQLKKLLGEEA